MPATQTDRLQGLTTSVAVKPPCKAVTTVALTLNGEQSVGGVACVSGDRVLVAIAGGSVNNGIWVVDTGAWSRARDFDGNRDVVSGTIVLVGPGVDARFWQVLTPNPIVIGGTSITIEQIDPGAFSAPDSAIAVQQPFTGAVVRTQHDKNSEVWSLQDAGGVAGASAAANAAAAAVADAAGRPVFLPFGTYQVSGAYQFTQRYYGPGTLTYSGIGSVAFGGAGINDIAVSGSYSGVGPRSIVVKINTAGTPDTLAISYDGGATFVTTQAIYDPVTDSYTNGPINLGAGPIALGGTGVTVNFGASTGHTVGNTWSFMLRQNPIMPNSNGMGFALMDSPFIVSFGTKNLGMGPSVFGGNGTVGIENTAFGANALFSNTTGYANMAYGPDSLRSNTSGFFNHAFGASSMRKNTTGFNNCAYGTYSLYENTSGSDNTAYGLDTMRYCVTGSQNTAAGEQALYQNEAGILNSVFGLWAARGGSASLPQHTSLNNSCAFGARALFTAQGTDNVAMGLEALYNATGSFNVGIGSAAGYRITSGTFNLFAGYNSGQNALQKADAQDCVALGPGAYTTGNNAIAIGSGVVAGLNEIVLGNNFSTVLRVSTDNTINLGSGSRRMATLFAGTGTINTSDEREKTDFQEASEAERRVALAIKGSIRKFKFVDAVQQKGAGARWHFGVGAQTVAAAFRAEGLDPHDYGLFCYDEWPAEPEVVDEAGAVLSPARPAGNRFGIRYDELAMFILAAI